VTVEARYLLGFKTHSFKTQIKITTKEIQEQDFVFQDPDGDRNLPNNLQLN